jgi:pimeloyl-ACP methyl ester carboxylesterase
MTRRTALKILSTGTVSVLATQAQDSVERTANYNGIPLHYESYGSGTHALVFIHGWTCDLTFWRRQAPVYQGHRSLLIDLPGHGKSAKPHIGYPMELFARSVDAVMTDAGAQTATFVGHSLGGPIVYAYLRLFPEKAHSMVLVDINIRRGSAGPIDAVEQKHRMARIARSMQGLTGDHAFERTIESCFTKLTPEDVKEEVRRKMLATPKHVRIAAITSPSSLPPPGKDETFSLPSVALQASSPLTGAHYRTMKTLFTKLDLDVWNGSGHFLMMENPERFNQSLEGFLEKVL